MSVISPLTPNTDYAHDIIKATTIINIMTQTKIDKLAKANSLIEKMQTELKFKQEQFEGLLEAIAINMNCTVINKGYSSFLITYKEAPLFAYTIDGLLGFQRPKSKDAYEKIEYFSTWLKEAKQHLKDHPYDSMSKISLAAKYEIVAGRTITNEEIELLTPSEINNLSKAQDRYKAMYTNHKLIEQE